MYVGYYIGDCRKQAGMTDAQARILLYYPQDVLKLIIEAPTGYW